MAESSDELIVGRVDDFGKMDDSTFCLPKLCMQEMHAIKIDVKICSLYD